MKTGQAKFFAMIAIYSFFLISCATVTSNKADLDGKNNYAIDCSGVLIPINICFKKAEELCPSGYSLVSEATGPTNANLSWYNPKKIISTVVEIVPGIKKGIVIQCNKTWI